MKIQSIFKGLLRWGASFVACSLLFVPATGLYAAAAPAAAAPQPVTVPFDHLTTGYELDGVHRDLPCESCHLNAIFKGTPRDCGTCHITGSQYNATPKNAAHIISSNNCAQCHTTISFRPAVTVDHTEVMGSCISCHNGTIAQGEGPKHPATSQDCATCHSVLAWNPPKVVDHTQIPMAVSGFCIICHNGVQASGKNVGHVTTSLECGDCHLTTTWLGASFDHTGIVSGCYACHNGVKAVGKQGTHMPTSNLCENCHTTGLGAKSPSWVPSLFDHTQMSVTTCQTCHSGTVKTREGFVSGQPVNHVPPIPSTIDCGVCHGNTPTAETWKVLASSIAVLHTGLPVSNCLMCHAGDTFAGVPAPYIPMSISGVSPTKLTPLSPPHIPVIAGSDCSACHGAAYQAGGFGPATAMTQAKHAFVTGTCDTCHDTGKSFYVGTGTALQLRPADHINSPDSRMQTSDCSLCHETKDWLSTVLPLGHMPNPSNLTCAQCHSNAPTDYLPTTLASITTLHTGITNNCSQCHGNYATALTWFNNYTPKDAILTPIHIPYLLGTDCSNCHTANYVTGGFGPTTMSATKHTFVPTSCDTCHEAGLSFYMGTSTPALQSRPADHLASASLQEQTGDCSGCHETTDWKSTVMPGGHMPNPGNQTCATCHTAIDTSTLASYATLASVAVLHTGISGNCSQCHGNYTTALTFYNNNDNPKAAILTPAHIPYIAGTDCSSCHTANYVVGGFGPTAMSAAKHAFTPAACDTCHEAGLSFYMGTSTPALQGRPLDHQQSAMAQMVTGDCASCHETTDWKSSVMPTGHMPNPANQACSVCHTAISSTLTSYTTLASISVMHTGITSGCIACHGSTTQLTFYGNFDNPKAGVLTPAHIPYLASTDCVNCHAMNYVVGGFGPTNMSAAKHAFVPTTCDTCHNAGLTFYMGLSTPALQGRPTDSYHSSGTGLTSDCSACHETTDWNSTALPSGHMPNPGNQGCTVCHASAPTDYTSTTLAANSALHTGITAGECSQCHGGATALTWTGTAPAATPKDGVLSPVHIPAFTGLDCSSCHTSTTYAVGGFGPMNMTQTTHSGVGTTCNTCHEAGLSFYMGAASPGLQGRPADHTFATMVGPTDCSTCHTTANWISTTLPTGHMPNPASQACTVCHIAIVAAGTGTYATLAANSVLHTGIAAGQCSQCHGGTTALTFYNNNENPLSASSLSPAHIPFQTGTDCSSCHTSTTYAVGSFGPMNMTQATHAFVSTTCDTCHQTGLSFYMGAASPALQLRPTDTTHASGTGLTSDCSACHSTANWTTTALPTGHMPNPANQTCTLCHTTAPADYTTTTLAANLVLHTGITSGECSQCHGGTTALTWYNAFTPKDGVLSPTHIPYLTGTDCGSCHSTTTYAVGAFGPMNMTQATHAFVSTTCDTCHQTGLSFYMGAASPVLQLRPTDSTHASGTGLTGDCSGCHTTANWNSTAIPTGHMPNPANQACTVCHTDTTNYATLATNLVMHTGITAGECSQCHGGTTALTWYNAYTPKDGVLSPAHMTYLAGTDCGTCHTTTTYATGAFGPMNMTSALHSDVVTTCLTCHETGSSFYMGAASPKLQLRPSGHHTGSACNNSGCHTTKNWNAGVAKPPVATPVKSVIGTVIPAPAAATGGVGRAQSGAVSAGSVNLRGLVSGSAPAATTTAGIGKATAGLSHIGVTDNCISCHNGVLAAGKGPNHIASNDTCQNCHTTIAWLPARFDHQGVTASCASCHNGVIAQGEPRQHILTTLGCANCHNTISWLGASFSHQGVTGTCQSCHNGVTAIGKQAGHAFTTQDCGSCHSVLSWTIVAPAKTLRPLVTSPHAKTSEPIK